jgi:hypothetical protein
MAKALSGTARQASAFMQRAARLPDKAGVGAGNIEQNGSRLLAIAGLAALGAFPAPAHAQTRIQVIAPDCERSRGGDEIVVCGQREERSRYRIPEPPDTGFDPSGTIESVSRERNALTEPGAAAGIGSCTNVGPGGWTGCRAQEFRREIDQYGGDPPSLRNGYRRGRR